MAEEQRQGSDRRDQERRRRVPGPPGPPGGTERRQRSVGWRSRDILRAALLIAAVFVFLRLLWFASSLFFVAFLGVLFGLALSAGVDQLNRLGAPRAVGAIMIVVIFIALLTGLGAMMAPALREQVDTLRRELPAGIDRFERWIERQQGGVVGVILGTEDPRPAPGVQPPPEPGLRERLTGELGNISRYLFPFLSSTVAVLAGLLMVLFIAIYISVQPSLYRSGLMHMFPHSARPRAEQLLHRMAVMLQRWLLTQLVAMVAVGIITTVTLMLLRVPSALALGVLAGLLEFVPIVGPIIASLPAIAMAFIDGPEKAVAVTLAFIAIQQFESQVITPVLMKEGVDLPPVVTILVQAIMAAIFGFIGLIVAVPLMAAAMVPIKMLYVEGVVGDPMTLPGGDADAGPV